jgi:hypothetical protein
MDVQQIDDVARLPSARRRQCFVGRDVGGMQHITEQLILQGREKPIGAIHSPFKQRPAVAGADDCREKSSETGASIRSEIRFAATVPYLPSPPPA